MIFDADELYTKVAVLEEIYNLLVQTCLFKIIRMSNIYHKIL